MSIWTIVTNIFKPVSDVVESFNLTEREKEKYHTAAIGMQFDLASKIIELEKKELEAKEKILEAEIAGKSWIQRAWRPITMLTFLCLIVLDAFNLLPSPLPPQAWTLLTIGMSGFLGSRSVEKIAPSIAKAIDNRNKS